MSNVAQIISATARKDAGKTLHKTPEYAVDPKKAIMDFVTPFLGSMRIAPAKLLTATFRQQEKTAGGLYVTDRHIDEDQYQGICGLVLKIGPMSFIDDGRVKFGGFKVEEWQWIIYRPDNSDATSLRGLHCRFIEDVNIISVVDDPELFW